MFLHVVILAGGLTLLIFGAEWLIRGASSLARKFNVSDLAIGLTVVAFGTSAPELVVNSISSYQGHQDLVFGNVLGSNNFNLFIILGLAGVITPMVVQSSTAWKEIPISLAGMIILYLMVTWLGSDPVLSRIEGCILLVFFLAFLTYVYRQLRTDPESLDKPQKEQSNLKILLWTGLGLTGLVVGGRLMVDQAVIIAEQLGMSEKMIGLTIVAAGTSLPELATTVMAAIKKNNDIAVGNIIGSNIFNIFFILGVSALIRPIPYDPVFNTEIFLIAGGTAFLLLAMYTGQRKKLDRWEAILLLAAYLIYLTWLLS